MLAALLGLALIGLLVCLALEWSRRRGPFVPRAGERFPTRHLAAAFFLSVLLWAWFGLSYQRLTAQDAPRPAPVPARG